MFQVGIDGFILSQSADLIHPANERLIRSSSYSFRRSLEDLAFCLVYADRILKYGELRPPRDTSEYGAPHLLAEIERNESGLFGQFVVDRDIHGNQLLSDPHRSEEIITALRTLERCVQSQHQPLYMEWLAREAAIYLGNDESVFEKRSDPSTYVYETTVPYHVHRKIQDSISEAVVSVLKQALPSAPAGSNQNYSIWAQREFITRNMLTLVTIMRAYEMSAERNKIWRMPHITRACIRLQEQAVHQLDLRRIVVRHALYRALSETSKDSPESIIRNLLQLRNLGETKTIRELLNTSDLLEATADERKEASARVLRREIMQAAPARDDEQDSFVLSRRSALRELHGVTWSAYEEQLFRVFPVLKTEQDSRRFSFLLAKFHGREAHIQIPMSRKYRRNPSTLLRAGYGDPKAKPYCRTKGIDRCFSGCRQPYHVMLIPNTVIRVPMAMTRKC